MPAVTHAASHERRDGGRQPQRLILCFDGTGNKFMSTPGDTNFVKLYNMFERTNRNQMHYYQPGIGTYPAEGPVNAGFFRVRGTAAFVRHAVAIDEHRDKFKAALFAQERPEAGAEEMVNTNPKEDIEEVWFPDNHGDIGGGWDDASPQPNITGWLRWKKKIPDAKSNLKGDKFQLSDIALEWMTDELDDVESRDDPEQRLAWEANYKHSVLERFTNARKCKEAISAKMHDTMAFGGGSAVLKVLFWDFMERLPIIKRWEYAEEEKKSGRYIWQYVLFPLNMGGRRDIPSTALFHHAVRARMSGVHAEDQTYPKHNPSNEIWIQTLRWLKIVLESVELDRTKKPREWQLNELAKRESAGERQVNGI